MTSFAPVSGLIGGVLIGLAAIILMLTIGRIAGVCGIVVNAMTTTDVMGRLWRLAFILGLPLGALLVTAFGLKDWSSVTFPAADDRHRWIDRRCGSDCWIWLHQWSRHLRPGPVLNALRRCHSNFGMRP